MPNGVNLTGIITTFGPTGSTSQGSLIIPIPDSTGKYYVFSLVDYQNRGRLFYSLVDMDLNGGYGDVRPGAKGILLDTAFTEKMTAVVGDHCNIWLLLSALDGSVKAYEISASGVINPTPVISTGVGLGSSVSLEPMGGIAVSPDRHKLAATKMGTGGITAELYDFDPATGIVSNPLPLINNVPCYSVCFSPDNSKLYVVSSNPALIHQFDLSSGDSSVIAGTQTRIGAVPFTTHLKRGPDDKIYFFQTGSAGALGRINMPNMADSACQYTTGAVMLLAGTTKGYGLPNVVPILKRDSFFNVYTLEDCQGDFTLLKADTTSGSDYVWNDGMAGQERSVATEGTWWVQYHTPPCIMHVDTFYVRKINLDPIIAVNEFELRTTRSYSTYQWYLNGEIILGATQSTYLVTENGDYTVVVGDEQSGCVDTSGIYTVSNVTYVNNVHPMSRLVRIFPNPARDMVQIDAPVPVKLKLCNIEGRILSTYTERTNIEINDLPKGVYLLRVEDRKGILVKVFKVIKI